MRSSLPPETPAFSRLFVGFPQCPKPGPPELIVSCQEIAQPDQAGGVDAPHHGEMPPILIAQKHQGGDFQPPEVLEARGEGGRVPRSCIVQRDARLLILVLLLVLLSPTTTSPLPFTP